MGFTLFFALLLTSFSSPALAAEVYPWEVKCMTAAMKSVENMGSAETCRPPEKTEPACAELTDDLCDALWLDKNKGHLDVFDGSLDVGRSPQSQTSKVILLNTKALLESESALPEDLKKKTADFFPKFRETLKNESDTKAWYREFSDKEYDWTRIVQDVADERTIKKHPELASIKTSDLTVVQASYFQEELNGVKRSIVEAKYKNNPNWQRVERVYKEAQEDLIKQIELLKISASQKKALSTRIQSVSLSLPYEDYNSMNAGGVCGRSSINAFYQSSVNKFTVCESMFNSLRSDSVLYGTIAHELSHSIDPNRTSQVMGLEQSSLYKDLYPLVGSSTPPFSCDKWKTVVAEASKIKATVPKYKDPMQSIYTCVSNKTVDPWNKYLKIVDGAAESMASDSLSDNAEANNFTYLAQPTTTQNGVTKTNEYYRRPDIIMAQANENQFDKLPYRQPYVAEIFNQSLACAEVNYKGKNILYENAPTQIRSEIFNKAMAETRLITKAKYLNSFAYCGANCSNLVSYNLAVNSNENFADWMALRAFSEHLNRLPDMRSKREASALVSADLCTQPGVSRNAPDLMAAEKAYSNESHPDSRLRRLATYNKRNAELVKCEVDKHHQGFEKCEQK